MKNRAAFTLIELLVVIAMIAILAGILFPVFARAKDKGRQTMCVSNMRQMGMATIMYLQDYDETFPFINSILTVAEGDYWGYTLQPYINSRAIFECSSKAGDHPRNDYCVNGARNNSGRNIFGCYIRGVIDQRSAKLPLPGSDARIILVIEEARELSWGDYQNQFYGEGTGVFDPGVHSGGDNILFVDGHVKWQNVDGMPDLLDTWDLAQISWDIHYKP